MPDVLVRNIDVEVLEKMKLRAKLNGRSLQAELKMLIGSSVSSNGTSDIETARNIKAKLRGRQFSDSADILREDRER